MVVFDPRRKSFWVLPGDAAGLVYLNGEVVYSPTQINRDDVLEMGQTKLVLVPFCGEKYSWDRTAGARRDRVSMRFLPGNAQHIGARHSQQDSFGFADPDDRRFHRARGFSGGGLRRHGRHGIRRRRQPHRGARVPGRLPAQVPRGIHSRRAGAQRARSQRSGGRTGAQSGLSEGIGTTLVATALHDASLYFISVGDSGMFYCSGGQCRTLNRPHIFANVLDAAVARGSLSREDAESHPERESLTSFIGAEKLEEIDRNVEPFPLAAGDTILLASDGHVQNTGPARNPGVAARRAANLAGVAGGTDPREKAGISGQRDGGFGDA